MRAASSTGRQRRPILLVFLCIGAVGSATLAVGCSGPARAPAVDPSRAREALETTLTRWEQGGRPEDLRTNSPPITVQDLDWEAGTRLVRFQVLDDGRDDDANLRVPVELTLQGPDGREVARRVNYLIGTSPSLTVFREMF